MRERFDGPAVPHEAHGKEIEQLLIDRWLAGMPEIARSVDNAFPEKQSPDAIDNDACRQRVCRVGDRFSEIASAAAVGKRRVTLAGQHLHKLARSNRTLSFDIAAQENIEILRL